MLDICFHQHERWNQRNIWYCTITNNLRKGHHLIHIRNVFDLFSFGYFQIFIKKRFTCHTIDEIFCGFERCGYVFSACVCIICQNDKLRIRLLKSYLYQLSNHFYVFFNVFYIFMNLINPAMTKLVLLLMEGQHKAILHHHLS